jgi:hypothetical protein
MQGLTLLLDINRANSDVVDNFVREVVLLVFGERPADAVEAGSGDFLRERNGQGGHLSLSRGEAQTAEGKLEYKD